jgi:hypothetical protein
VRVVVGAIVVFAGELRERSRFGAAPRRDRKFSFERANFFASQRSTAHACAASGPVASHASFLTRRAPAARTAVVVCAPEL